MFFPFIRNVPFSNAPTPPRQKAEQQPESEIQVITPDKYYWNNGRRVLDTRPEAGFIVPRESVTPRTKTGNSKTNTRPATPEANAAGDSFNLGDDGTGSIFEKSTSEIDSSFEQNKKKVAQTQAEAESEARAQPSGSGLQSNRDPAKHYEKTESGQDTGWMDSDDSAKTIKKKNKAKEEKEKKEKEKKEKKKKNKATVGQSVKKTKPTSPTTTTTTTTTATTSRRYKDVHRPTPRRSTSRPRPTSRTTRRPSPPRRSTSRPRPTSRPTRRSTSRPRPTSRPTRRPPPPRRSTSRPRPTSRPRRH